MVFTTAGGGASQLYPYEIDNSLRFNEQDDAKLSFDPDSAGNVDTMTISFWMKPDLNFGGDHNNIFSVRPSAGSYAMLVHRTGGEILFEHSGAGDILKTNRLFRDPSAWYHIVLALDSTNSTASLRARLYVNGIEETSFATDGRASHSQNTDFLFGGTNPHQISGDPTGGSFYGGYLSEMYYVNGSQLAPTEFGEFNENGVWVPKAYSGSYGTNGFKLEFQDSGNLGDDTSGNGNDFTPTNLTATDQTTDTPTNNWCTFNPLTATGGTYSEGNTVITTGSNASRNERGTFGMDNGKWYWEYKLTGSSIDNIYLGIGTTDTSIGSEQTGTYTYYSSGSTGRIYTGGSIVATPTAFAVGDIVSIGYNADDNQVLFYLNGSLVHTTSSVTDITYNPFARIFYTTSQVEANFGNPPFTISSGNSDGAGFGNFEYAVPSGYYALCTKNLAEYG